MNLESNCWVSVIHERQSTCEQFALATSLASCSKVQQLMKLTDSEVRDERLKSNHTHPFEKQLLLQSRQGCWTRFFTTGGHLLINCLLSDDWFINGCRGGIRNFHLGATHKEYKVQNNNSHKVPSRGYDDRSPPEAKAVCRPCLQILTAEMIRIWTFCTIHPTTSLFHGGG